MLSIIVKVTRGFHVLTLSFVEPSVEAGYALLPTAPNMSPELEALTLSLRESQLELYTMFCSRYARWQAIMS